MSAGDLAGDLERDLEERERALERLPRALVVERRADDGSIVKTTEIPEAEYRPALGHPFGDFDSILPRSALCSLGLDAFVPLEAQAGAPGRFRITVEFRPQAGGES